MSPIVAQPLESKDEILFGAREVRLAETTHRRVKSVGEVAASGSMWRIGGQVGRTILQLVSLVYLSRILPPSEFGAVSFGMFFIGLGQLFVVGGPTVALIQAPSLSKDDIAHIVWLNTLVASAISAAIVVAAFVVAANPSVFRITLVLAAAFLLSSFSMAPFALLQRDLRFAFLAIVEVLTYLVANVGLVIVLAHAGLGGMSLAIGHVCHALICAAIAIAARPIAWRWTGGQSSTSIKRIRSFGFAVSLGEVLYYGIATIDIFLVGKFLGSEALGYYSRAVYLIRTPAIAVLCSIHAVLFAVLARFSNDLERVGRFYERSVACCLAILTPCAIYAAAFAEPLIRVLFGSAWGETAKLMQILSVLLLASVSTLGDAVLKAAGHVRTQLICRVIVLGFSIPTIAWALWGGLATVAIATATANTLLAVLIHVAASRLVGIGLARQIRMLQPAALIGVACGAALWSAQRALEGQQAHEVLQICLGLGVALGVSCVAVWVLPCGADTIRADLRRIAGAALGPAKG